MPDLLAWLRAMLTRPARDIASQAAPLSGCDPDPKRVADTWLAETTRRLDWIEREYETFTRSKRRSDRR